METFLVLLSVSLILGTRALCPHERPGLFRWSNDSSWPDGKPNKGDSIVISTSILVDESPPELYNITIASGDRLVFDPTSPLEFTAHNIFVNGGLEIGSEDCPYSNQLNIILQGTRASHSGEETPKVIMVNAGGTLEIHGEKKMTWTKLNGTQGPSANNAEVLFDHSTFNLDNPSIPTESWADITNTNGLAAYTIKLDQAGNPSIKQFAVYDLVKDGGNLAQQIEEVEDGEILMMALQRRFNLKNSNSEQFLVFDALEMLIYGEINQASTLRTAGNKNAYAMVFQKGSNPALLSEEKRKMGTTTVASITIGDNVFAAESLSTNNKRQMVDNFKIHHKNAMHPRIDVIDDVTTWNPGDTVVFASTDYDWNQAEERRVVRCNDCSGKQFRIDSLLEYVHWGEFMHEAVDMRAEVGLLTRNVVIEGTVLSRCPEFNDNCKRPQVRGLDTFGGQIKIMSDFESVHIEGVELRNMGQQTDDGRYPIHFHLCLDNVNGAYVRESTVHNSFARCVTIHGSHDIQIIDNFCYNHMGHGFFLEDGAEKNNTFDGNLVMTTRFGTGKIGEPLDKTNPASFWITNPNTRFINNHAAGGEGTGAWFIYPEWPLSPSRALAQMDIFEARSTPIQEFYNNAAHSNSWIGIIFGSRLSEDRVPIPANFWQPRTDPKNSTSEPLKFTLEKITGYKNRRNNVWVEAGMVTVTKVSSSDSLNGITVTNDGLVDEFTGQLTDSVVIGDSSNIGVPSTIPTRSIPLDLQVEEPHSGLTLWKGPTRISNVWFGGQFNSRFYDIGGIAMKRFSPYFFSMQTTLSNMLFSFDDKANGGRRAVSGLEGLNSGWRSRDGALMAGFTLKNNESAFENPTYIVRPDHLSAAAEDCRIRTDWRFAICTTKYGNLKVFSSKPTTFVLHDLPSAELWFSGSGNGGPQVVLDGSKVYTVHFESNIPSKLVFTGEGMEANDTLTIGVCLPRGASFILKSKTPETVKPEDFIEVDSLAELRTPSEFDGRRIFYEEKTGMLYFKFIDTRVKPADAMHPCTDGICPDLVIDNIRGDKSDADCRRRIYRDDLDLKLPSQPKFSEVIPKNGGPTPPEGWGAGSTRPFDNRVAVDGGFGNWTEWSSCSSSCGAGVTIRSRKCNNPIPTNGGLSCQGNYTETKPCLENQCAVDGKFSDWSLWGECVLNANSTCQGSASRTRSCSNPEPQFDGMSCDGASTEVKSCSICST